MDLDVVRLWALDAVTLFIKIHIHGHGHDVVCTVTELSGNSDFNKKEGMKERKTFLVLDNHGFVL